MLPVFISKGRAKKNP